MISIRYQVFFIDSEQEKTAQLAAVQPMFSSPAAVEALLRTLKFENKKAIIVIGNKEQIEKLLDKANRADVVDWGNFEPAERAKALIELATSMGMEVREDRLMGDGEHETQVLGLDPIVVEAAKSKYPIDLPKQNQWLWDGVVEKYPAEIKAGKSEEEKEARHRILYKAAASALNVIPWNITTVNRVTQQREAIRVEVARGEERAGAVVDKLAKWLLGADLIKKPRSQKHFDTDYNNISSKYEISHVVGARCQPTAHWDDIAKFLLHKDSFSRKGRTALTLGVDHTTRLDVEYENDEIAFYIVHTLTPQQASMLTQESQEDLIIKKLNKLVKVWYKVGDFPNLDTID